MAAKTVEQNNMLFLGPDVQCIISTCYTVVDVALLLYVGRAGKCKTALWFALVHIISISFKFIFIVAIVHGLNYIQQNGYGP